MMLSTKHQKKFIISAALSAAIIYTLSMIYRSAQLEFLHFPAQSPVAQNKSDLAIAAADSAQPNDTSTSTRASRSDRTPRATQASTISTSDSESPHSAAQSPRTPTNAKSTIEFLQAMDDRAFVDWLLGEWTNSQQPNYQPPDLDEDAFTLAFERRAPGVLQELRKQASAGRAGAANLLSDSLRTCAQTPKPGCPPAPEAQAEAERIDWAAAEAGQAYPMVKLWMDATNREDANYYHDHIATVERMRLILQKNVQLGDCVALDWLAASYSLHVEIPQYRQPLLSYRYRFALLHAPFASQQYLDMARKQVSRAQEQIRPELLRAEEKIALELVQKSFQIDTPNCQIGRNTEFNSR